MKLKRVIREVLKQSGIPSNAVIASGAGHLKFKVNGTMVVCSASPSDCFAAKKIAKDIERARNKR